MYNRIFPVNTFEMKSDDASIPESKDELLSLAKSGDLVPFGDQAQGAHGDRDTVDPDLTDWWGGSFDGILFALSQTDMYISMNICLQILKFKEF